MADDVARDDQVADVLDDDDERGGQDDEDGAEVELRRVERRQGEPRRALDKRPVDDAADGRDDVAADDADEDRDDGEEALEGDGGEDGDGQRRERDEHRRAVRLVAREAGHARGCRHELEADDGDDGTHRGGREDHIDPARADGAHEQADEAEDDADADEAAEGCLIAVLREHEEDRREEGKARAEVGRDLPLAEHEVEDRADAVEQEDRGRVDLEEDRYEHGGAEHREEMLQREWDRLEKRQLLFDTNGTFLQDETLLSITMTALARLVLWINSFRIQFIIGWDSCPLFLFSLEKAENLIIYRIISSVFC